ncbi:hypothetical protein HAHE_08500 [Haloferula helveola]|uniref:Uncharacterized protein n=1 Tax=Haloferula helveola TaxID=490095 RepID=A0ABM7RIT2_9BACT|nr:hypothetical protein HAHE_08500 [Haloferula helveola]
MILFLVFLTGPAAAQTPTYSFTFQVGSANFGIVSFGDFSYIMYGWGSVSVNGPAGYAWALVIGAVVLALLLLAGTFDALRRTRRGPGSARNDA